MILCIWLNLTLYNEFVDIRSIKLLFFFFLDYRVESTKQSGWTLTEDDVLVDSLVQLSQAEWLPELNDSNLTRVQTLMKSQLPGWFTKTRPDILGRSNWLKKRYFAIREMRSKGILDWDDDQMMLVGDEVHYKEFAKVIFLFFLFKFGNNLLCRSN